MNQVTFKTRYQLPRIDDLFNQLKLAEVVSKSILKLGYHQLKTKEVEIMKSDLRKRYEYDEFFVIPFGLSYAPIAFMDLTNQVFN